MRIWTAEYRLRSRYVLGAASGALERQGSLLKVETEEGIGYADIHPWPELGDETLPEHLESLRREQPTELAVRSLALADLDRKARVAKHNAFDGLTIPASHFLVTDTRVLGPDLFKLVRKRGFSTLKIKIGRKFSVDIERLLENKDELAEFRLRLDFNGARVMEDFDEIQERLSALHVEFIEDPLPWNVEQWQALSAKLAWPLALDRQDHVTEAELQMANTSLIVIKPAVQNPRDFVALAESANASLVVTSYLDHPVGQAGAALEATLLAQDHPHLLRICGLSSQEIYEGNRYSDVLGEAMPLFSRPEGYGIGFDRLLASEKWEELK